MNLSKPSENKIGSGLKTLQRANASDPLAGITHVKAQPAAMIDAKNATTAFNQCCLQTARTNLILSIYAPRSTLALNST
jgi:hypothetical protein